MSFLAISSPKNHKLHNLNLSRVLPCHHTRLFKSRSQSTFADSFISLPSLHAFPHGSVLCSTHTRHLSVPQTGYAFSWLQDFSHAPLFAQDIYIFFGFKPSSDVIFSRSNWFSNLYSFTAHGPTTVVITMYREDVICLNTQNPTLLFSREAASGSAQGSGLEAETGFEIETRNFLGARSG